MCGCLLLIASANNRRNLLQLLSYNDECTKIADHSCAWPPPSLPVHIAACCVALMLACVSVCLCVCVCLSVSVRACVRSCSV